MHPFPRKKNVDIFYYLFFIILSLSREFLRLRQDNKEFLWILPITVIHVLKLNQKKA